MWLKALGKISVEPKRNRIVVNVSRDFIDYYNWHIGKKYWIRMGTPMHGAHITLVNPKLHKKGISWKRAMDFHNKQIQFEYNTYIIEGGYTKGFLMYYTHVRSAYLESIKATIGVKDSDKYRGLHITLATSKGNNLYPDWPKMIELR